MSVIKGLVVAVHSRSVAVMVVGTMHRKPLFMALSKQGTVASDGSGVIRAERQARRTLAPVHPHDPVAIEVEDDTENGFKIAWALDNGVSA